MSFKNKLKNIDRYPAFKGAFFMTLACLLGAWMTCVGKSMDFSSEPALIVAYRNIFSFLLLLPFVLRGNNKSEDFADSGIGKLGYFASIFSLKSMMVGGAFFGSLYLWYYCLDCISVSHIITLSFTTPLFVILLSTIFLREKIGFRQKLALMVSFLGALLIINVDLHGSMYSLLAIAASALWAFIHIMLKSSGESKDGIEVLNYCLISLLPISLLIIIMNPTIFHMRDMIKIILIAALSNAIIYFTVLAYRSYYISHLQAIDFTRFIFAAILANLFFDEQITMMMIIGGLITFSGSLMIVQNKPQGSEAH